MEWDDSKITFGFTSCFEEIANVYYEEMNRLFSKANYYSMDPFHEGISPEGIDLHAVGEAIMSQMKRQNANAKWVIMAWQLNPCAELIEKLKEGDLLVIDIFAESVPHWGDPSSSCARENGFGHHDWLFDTVLNYGGNAGLHGKMEHVINSFYYAKNYPVFSRK